MLSGLQTKSGHLCLKLRFMKDRYHWIWTFCLFTNTRWKTIVEGEHAQIMHLCSFYVAGYGDCATWVYIDLQKRLDKRCTQCFYLTWSNTGMEKSSCDSVKMSDEKIHLNELSNNRVKEYCKPELFSMKVYELCYVVKIEKDLEFKIFRATLVEGFNIM